MRVMSKRNMQYGSRFVMNGELFDLEGQVNDTRMLRSLRYFAPWDGGDGVRCPECERVFAVEANLAPHHVAVHSEAAKKRQAEEARVAASRPAVEAELRRLCPPATHRCACGNEHPAPLNGGAA